MQIPPQPRLHLLRQNRYGINTKCTKCSPPPQSYTQSSAPKHKRLAKPRVRKNRPRPRRRERNISDSCLLVQVSKQIPTNLLRLAYRFRSQYTPVAAVTCNLLLLVLDLAVDRVKPHKPVILGENFNILCELLLEK